MTSVHEGSSWKERRESMGKTIGQVSGDLRIGHRYLAGIEEGRFEEFPERVFSTGFIRSYAKYLSQDPGPMLAEYERSIADRDDSEAAAQLRFRWVERDRERGSRRATYTFAAGGVLLVGVVLAWVTLHTERYPLAPPAAVVSSVPAVENAAKAGDNAADAAPSGVGNMAEPVPPPARDAPSPAAPAASVSVVGGIGLLVGPFQLFLEASEQVWVMYSFDDGDPIDVTLYAGDKISIQASRRITLKLGNAGGVAGTLNGQRLAPFGKRGQVRKFGFGQ